jgi:hypothetical protein
LPPNSQRRLRKKTPEFKQHWTINQTDKDKVFVTKIPADLAFGKLQSPEWLKNAVLYKTVRSRYQLEYLLIAFN